MDKIYFERETFEQRTMNFIFGLASDIVKYTLIFSLLIIINSFKELFSLKFIKNKIAYGIITVISIIAVFLFCTLEYLIFTPFAYFVLVGGVIGSIKQKINEYKYKNDERNYQ